MSIKFNQEVNKYKLKIKEQCYLYRQNYEEFFDLIETLKRKNQITDESTKHCEHILSMMNNGEVRVIFCGQVKSGKTKCVMEFLSGAIELPSKDVPATKYFTKLFFADIPVLYSESPGTDRKYHEFDGKFVSDKLIENRENSFDEDEELDIIFNIGISDTFLKDCVMVIDSPGLNETKRLDEVFKMNLRKLNPQIVIYIFNYGPGFVDSDCIYYTTVISTLRKDLRQIFLFNKFDEAFNLQKKWQDPDESESEVDSDDYDDIESDEDDECSNFDDLYQQQFDKHKRKLDSIHCGMSCPCLIGYSGKYIGMHRKKKVDTLKQFCAKHLELLNHLKCSINSMDIDVLENILSYMKLFLFTEFKTIFKQIDQSNNTSQHSLLSVCYKEKILNRFSLSHEKLLNINISQIPDIQFDGAISQIVKNQERIQTTGSQTKFFNIINSLTKYFIDRYVNFFSNIILTKVEELSFDKLNDDLRLNELDKGFSHTYCLLSWDVENIETIISAYFETEEERVKEICLKADQIGFPTSEACTFFIKNHYKFEKERIWINVNDFIKQTIEKERNILEKAIEEKKNDIISVLTLSKEQIKVMIMESLFLLKKYLTFNNNYILEQSKSEFTNEEKRNFFLRILNSNATNERNIVGYENSLNIVFKSEHFDMNELSFHNCWFIKYFLRTQYISNNTCKTIFYYNDQQKSLFIITEYEDWAPLRRFLEKGVTDADKLEIIKNLIPILTRCYKLCLPLDNFGPDMVFCKQTEAGIEIKIVETTQLIDEWQYTLVTGQLADFVFHKYPFTDVDPLPSMFYSLCWTILIILHGSCENLLSNPINEMVFSKEIGKLFPEFSKEKIFIDCCRIIKLGLKGAIKFDEMNEIVTILEDMIEEHCLQASC